MPQQPRPHAGLALGAAWERIAADFLNAPVGFEMTQYLPGRVGIGF